MARWWLSVVLMLSLVASASAGVFKPRGQAPDKKPAPSKVEKSRKTERTTKARPRRAAPRKAPKRKPRVASKARPKPPPDDDEVIIRDDDD